MLIREMLQLKQGFSEVEKILADYILENVDTIRKESARNIATKTFTSPASITRLCQHLGYKGYPDFREDFLKECDYLQSHFREIDANFPFQSGDAPIVVANKLSGLYGEFLADTASLLNPEQLLRAVEVMRSSRVIRILSTGAHGHLAYPFQEKMAKIGKQVEISLMTDLAFYQAGMMHSDEMFLFVSYSGEIDGILRVAEKAKKRKIPSVCFTSYGGNSLAALSDIVFYVSTRESLNTNLGSFGVYISVLYLFDVLYSCCLNENYQENLIRKIRISSEFQKKRHSKNAILQDT